MEGVVNKLVDLAGDQFMVPVALCAVLVLIFKWLSGLNHQRTSARKDFLELFREESAKNDLWLSVAIRHHCGVYLPVSVIRKLCALDQPARAIVDVANAWDLVEIDDATGEIRWRRKWFGNPKTRNIIAVALMVGYGVAAMVALLLGYILVIGKVTASVSFGYWLWVIIDVAVAWRCLSQSDLLLNGGKSLERWLGMKSHS